MNGSKLVAIGTLLIFCAAVVACQEESSQAPPSDAWGVVRVPSGQPIRIHLSFSRTDQNLGPFGIEQIRGAELAARQFDPIQGFLVTLDQGDPQCSTSGGVSTANEIAGAAGTVGTIGMTCSSSCIVSAPILTDAHIVEISPSCGANTLTDPVGHQDAFATTSYSLANEGLVGGDFAFKELGARKAAVISYDNAETIDAVNGFMTAFQASGGTIVSVSKVVPGQFTFRTAIQEAATSKPDMIYAPLLPVDAVTFTVQLRTSTLADTPVLGGRFYLSTWYIAKTGNSSDRLYAVGPGINDERFKSVAEIYKNVFGEEPSSAEFAFSYDAMHLLLGGIKKVAVVDRENNLIIGRKALQEAILSTAEFEGMTGPITCTAWGDCSAPKTLAVSQVRNGKWTSVFIP